MQLVVKDIEIAQRELTERGTEVGERGLPWGRFLFLKDPDGTTGRSQEISHRGRTEPCPPGSGKVEQADRLPCVVSSPDTRAAIGVPRSWVRRRPPGCRSVRPVARPAVRYRSPAFTYGRWQHAMTVFAREVMASVGAEPPETTAPGRSRLATSAWTATRCAVAPRIHEACSQMPCAATMTASPIPTAHRRRRRASSSPDAARLTTRRRIVADERRRKIASHGSRTPDTGSRRRP